ncbi:carbon-nitrogen family hydrolase [Ectobacillus sp. sgz5001026]|uniref:carbon-nitrogen family hydrolase n=1 Tax=Ectobacillus sp. sgz5001026 TaxID=3242473 RepID=UPI0036D3EB43
MKVACLQLDICFGDVGANVDYAEKEIEHVMEEERPDVVLLPELWTTGYDLERLNVLADEDGAVSKRILSDWAKRFEVNIVGGSIAKQTGELVTNTMYTFNKKGEQIGEYSKVHLFKLMNEHKFLSSGNEKGDFLLDSTPCAGLICYDIRFPEWVRTHTAQGVEVLFIVAEWPLSRLAHWRILLQARAIENQCFVVACNRSGNDTSTTYAGHSMVIDPWGEIIAEAGEKAENLIATFDVEKIVRVRNKIPVFEDRRPDLYK